MKRLTHEALAYEIVREEAHSIIPRFYAASLWDYVRAVKSYLRQNILILDEPEELLVSPVRMIDQIHNKGRAVGDCDDVAMLGACLLASVGIAARFKAVNPDPEDGHYRHVFVEFRIDGIWRALDPTVIGSIVYPSDWIVEEI